jgi:hypothetical protein
MTSTRSRPRDAGCWLFMVKRPARRATCASVPLQSACPGEGIKELRGWLARSVGSSASSAPDAHSAVDLPRGTASAACEPTARYPGAIVTVAESGAESGGWRASEAVAIGKTGGKLEIESIEAKDADHDQ